MTDAVRKGDEESDPYGARYARTVGNIEAGQMRDDAPNRAVLGEGEFRLRGHGGYLEAGVASSIARSREGTGTTSQEAAH